MVEWLEQQGLDPYEKWMKGKDRLAEAKTTFYADLRSILAWSVASLAFCVLVFFYIRERDYPLPDSVASLLTVVPLGVFFVQFVRLAPLMELRSEIRQLKKFVQRWFEEKQVYIQEIQAREREAKSSSSQELNGSQS